MVQKDAVKDKRTSSIRTGMKRVSSRSVQNHHQSTIVVLTADPFHSTHYYRRGYAATCEDAAKGQEPLPIAVQCTVNAIQTKIEKPANSRDGPIRSIVWPWWCLGYSPKPCKRAERTYKADVTILDTKFASTLTTSGVRLWWRLIGRCNFKL